ncbi:MAG: metallophosphoesterase [Candidatus Bathyarchaeota archaeon]|nr:metallophosphoesterase [Candidatus Bathyarchaeota archaeon]
MKMCSASKFAAAFLIIAISIGAVQASSQPVNASVVPEATLVSDVKANVETSGAEGNFSIIWITDTQYLSESYPTYYDSLCRWIVNNVEKYNVKMVIHTGDLVEDEGNTTHWDSANHSLSILLDAGIPYTWNAGNHDYNATCWIGNQYAAFNPANFEEEPYWVDDAGEGKNTAVQFTASGMDFLIVNVEYDADNATLEWANSILDAYPESHAIVGAHFYLNRTGRYEPWATNFRQTVLATHSNVFLTLSAHVHPLAYSGLANQVGDRHELVFNRQDKDNYMGGASLRILTFDTAHGIIDVKTFVIYANTFLTDTHSQFTLQTNFWNEAAVNEAEEIPEFPSTIAIVCVLALTAAVVGASRKTRKTAEN